VNQVQIDALADDALARSDRRPDKLRREHEHRIVVKGGRKAFFGQLGDYRLGGEIERHAQNVGVFDVEQTFFVQIVRLPAQCPANDWIQAQLQTAIAAELTLPLCALLPAGLDYLHRWPRRSAGAILLIGLSIVFATMSAAMAVMVVLAASLGW
jgi:hypothetical protein